MYSDKIIIDTHAHLCNAVFDKDRYAVLKNAIDQGVTHVISVGENLEDAMKTIKLATEHPEIIAAAGLYPSNTDFNQAENVYQFIRHNKSKLKAIGEIGLDYWIAKEEKEREKQQHILQGFISLATELDMPLNIHSRSAGRHVIKILLEAGSKRVQLHAFDGKASAAMPGVEAGYFFSVPPSIVRSKQKQKLIKHLPLSCLLLESDSPVLGPESGTRNEPANIFTALEAISSLKMISKEEVLEHINENARSLYCFGKNDS